jgi:integrase
VPLLAEVVTVVRQVIGCRSTGPVFLRERIAPGGTPLLVGDLATLERVCHERQLAVGTTLSRAEALRVASTVWREAGAVKADAIRMSFVRIMKAIGLPQAT